jgi:hypothetical protein
MTVRRALCPFSLSVSPVKELTKHAVSAYRIVWRMNTPGWLREGDPRLRGPYRQKIPKVQAILEWSLVTAVRIQNS